MITVSRVLCPVDQSPVSKRALEYATRLAGWYGARVRVLEVVALVLPPVSVPPTPSPYTFTVQARRAMVDELRQFVGPTSPEAVQVDFEIEEGEVVPNILRAAREWPADLVVMGSHGRSGFEHFALGSIVEKVLRKAPSPVVTVPPHLKHDQQPGSHSIVCAIDFSPCSLRAVEFALSLAQEADAHLVVAHVLEWPEGWEETLPDLRRDREKTARARLAGIVPGGADEWCRPEQLVVAGKPSREILKLAGDRRADLVVLGVHGRPAVDLALFGSTAYSVIRESTCPVLTVRS